MQTKILFLLLGLIITASSTGVVLYIWRGESSPKFEVKTMDYYLAHDEERETVYQDCQNRGVSETADTPEGRNCRAAVKARQHKAHVEAVGDKAINITPGKAY